MTTLEFKLGSNGFDGLYRINGKGAWRNEYNTDSLLANGEYRIFESGRLVGTWIQSTLGHELRTK